MNLSLLKCPILNFTFPVTISKSEAIAVEQNADGLLFLYITMKGPASDPVIKYDKKSVKEKIKTDVQSEKQNLKTILQQEFNKQQTEQQQIKDWKAPDEYEQMQFEDSSQTEEIDFNNTDSSNETENSVTRQKQKDALIQQGKDATNDDEKISALIFLGNACSKPTIRLSFF